MITKCWGCGKEVDYDFESIQFAYESKRIYVTSVENHKKIKAPEKIWKRVHCKECEEKLKSDLKKTKQIYIDSKIKILLERAIDSLEKQSIDIYDYEEAIKSVEEFAKENPSKFDSSYEMIAAMVLIKNRVETKLQYKIGKYRVDFFLPTLECILEIDGNLHDHNKIHDSKRDVELRKTLGDSWEVVRIPTKCLDENAKVLVKAIKELKKDKQSVRYKNGGVIPTYYSKRNEAYGYVKDIKALK